MTAHPHIYPAPLDACDKKREAHAALVGDMTHATPRNNSLGKPKLAMTVLSIEFQALCRSQTGSCRSSADGRAKTATHLLKLGRQGRCWKTPKIMTKAFLINFEIHGPRTISNNRLFWAIYSTLVKPTPARPQRWN